MAKIKLKHVNKFYDRHGRLRYICRPPGGKSKTLTGAPGSEAFIADYHDWLAKAGVVLTEIGASRSKSGTFNALIVKYFKDDAFTKGLASATQDMRRAILNAFRQTVAPSGQTYGDKQVATMRPEHINKILKCKSRNSQKNWLKAFRGLMVFATSDHPDYGDWRTDDPSAGIKVVKGPKSMGHMTWLEPQIEQYRKTHPLGTTARLAVELLLNIAARRHDAHEIGPQHVIISNRDGVKKLCWRPHKTLRSTAKMLKIRMLPSLQAALDAMPKPERGTELPLAFLTNDYRKPFASAAAFGNKFAFWCKQAGLKPVMCDDGRVRNYRAHGLRKAALRALAHAGATLPELMAVSGHKSPDECMHYIEEAEQERMADNAMDKLEAAEG